MKLARLGELGAEIPALLEDGYFYDLRGVVPDIDADALSPAGIQRIAASRATLPRLEGAERMRVGAPIARPSAVFCIGLNYVAHAAESNVPPPADPILFFKAPNTVVGPHGDVDIPRGSAKTDWEVELGVVIGSRALYLPSPADSRSHIAGYLAANDLSERDFQLNVSGGQWSKGKSSPGFSPLGPWLATADEIDPTHLRLRSWVNGEPRQDSTSADMIFSVDQIVWNLSQYVALEPGDVILTGTPEGVALSGRFPYLRAGDVVEVEIDGLGRQRLVMGQA